MNKIYILRHRWEIVGVFASIADAECSIKNICAENKNLLKENSKFKDVLETDFVIQERDFGFLFPPSYMARLNGAYWN